MSGAAGAFGRRCGLHTVTDAIYGALAEGDIGTHFPPSDPQWKGAASHIFLTHAVDLAPKGLHDHPCDLTLVCERPKIGPHAAAMRAALAGLLRIDADRVSVKATTTERLGFTGPRGRDRGAGHRDAGEAMTRLIATFGGVGDLRPAPGTWGSAAALPLAWAVHTLGGFWAFAIATFVIAAIGWWAVERELRAAPTRTPPRSSSTRSRASSSRSGPSPSARCSRGSGSSTSGPGS
jgi:2-C-methyl-D-erythritol 2,4-cyclodiphosphate synthase